MSGAALSCLLFYLAVSASALEMQKYERSVDTTLGHMFEHTVAGTAVACCFACSRDQGCRGVSYSPDSGRCELNGWAAGTMPTMYNNTPGVHAYVRGSPQCPVPWIMFEGHCYLFSMTKRNWTDSRDYCRGLGAELVDFQNVAESTFVRDKAIGLALGYTWIGIGDLWLSNTYTWTNGQSVTYQDWYTGQPDGNGTQNCVAIGASYGYGWRDLGCSRLNECSCKTVLL